MGQGLTEYGERGGLEGVPQVGGHPAAGEGAGIWCVSNNLCLVLKDIFLFIVHWGQKWKHNGQNVVILRSDHQTPM